MLLMSFLPFISAVARGGAGGAVPPQFFTLKVKTDLHKMKVKYYQTTAWEVFKKRTADEVYVCL